MPTPSASQSFILALALARDRLFTRARGAGGGTPATAEATLQTAIRQAFPAALADAAQDPVALVESHLPAASVSTIEPMPAEVWARVAAAVQIQAARSAGSPGLNPDHVLLSPDPLLAPKKIQRETDFFEGLDLSPASRFVVATVVALVIGIALTLYISTRKQPPPNTQPAATHMP